MKLTQALEIITQDERFMTHIRNRGFALDSATKILIRHEQHGGVHYAKIIFDYGKEGDDNNEVLAWARFNVQSQLFSYHEVRDFNP
jgi:hypothetical protein